MSPSVIATGGAYAGNCKRKCYRFRRRHRLVKHEVVALLQNGARFSQAELALKLAGNPFGHARLAIAVPKRILKSAVDRNFAKRVIREQFRLHDLRDLPVDLLVTLRDQVPGRAFGGGFQQEDRRRVRQTLTRLLGDVSRRFSART